MLIRVLKIPQTDGKFCFGGGNPQIWVEVDWFTDDSHPPETPINRKELEDFIKQKNYYSADESFLVLSEKLTFTINYKTF